MGSNHLRYKSYEIGETFLVKDQGTKVSIYKQQFDENTKLFDVNYENRKSNGNSILLKLSKYVYRMEYKYIYSFHER